MYHGYTESSEKIARRKARICSSNVIARLTVTRKNGWRTIVEVSADASLASFYRFFRQFEAKRSTKELIRTASRMEGCLSVIGPMQKPGLDLILQRLEKYGSESNPIVSTKLRIIKKRIYRKLISARPDELAMTRSRVNIPMQRFSPQRGLSVADELFQTIEQARGELDIRKVFARSTAP